MTEPITIEAVVHAPLEKAWQMFNEPEHIVQWGHASDDCTRQAINDLRVGALQQPHGSERRQLRALTSPRLRRDSPSQPHRLHDGRWAKSAHRFYEEGEAVRVIETFDPETMILSRCSAADGKRFSIILRST